MAKVVVCFSAYNYGSCLTFSNHGKSPLSDPPRQTTLRHLFWGKRDALSRKRAAISFVILGHPPFGVNMISFVIPAHNEQAWIGRCVAAAHSAAAATSEPYEVIVVDDGSTDRSGEIAGELGAEVLRVEHRHISATRNTGGRHARGDILFFVDADTLVSATVVEAALESVRAGAVGGGCVPRFEGRLPLWWRLSQSVFVGAARLLRLAGGACQFCTREAFEATGGFSEDHYAAEDLVFIKALKRQGRVVVLAEPVETSGRSLRNQSFWLIARLLTRLVIVGPDAFRQRTSAQIWYEPKREESR